MSPRPTNEADFCVQNYEVRSFDHFSDLTLGNMGDIFWHFSPDTLASQRGLGFRSYTRHLHVDLVDGEATAPTFKAGCGKE